MQEKDIREKLNKELEEMAPDMLQKILDTPIEPIKSFPQQRHIPKKPF